MLLSTLVVMLALAIRLVTLSSFSDGLYGHNLMPDEQVYDTWARALSAGESPPAFIDDFPALPAHVFAFAYDLLGADPSSVRFLNVLLGVGACLGLYLLGSVIGGRVTGLLSALLAALYGPFILLSVTAHKSALGLMLITLALWTGAAALTRPSPLRLLACGALLGLAVHVRQNALLWVVALPLALSALWYAARRARDSASVSASVSASRVAEDAPSANAAATQPTTTAAVWGLAAYGLGAALVLSPLAGGGVWGASEHGFNLYLANDLDNATAYFRPARFAPSQPAFQAGGFTLAASLETGRTLTSREAGAYYTDKLRDAWAREPRRALRKLAGKVGASLHSYEASNNHNLAFIGRFVAPLGLPWLGFGLLFALAVVGGWAERRRIGVRWLGLMALAYWLSLVLFFCDMRLRAPLALTLMPLAALGLQALLQVRPRARVMAAGALLLSALALTRLPVPGAGDLSTAHNMHALFLLDAGDLPGATRYYLRSLELKGVDSQSARLGLAAVLERKDTLRDAMVVLAAMDESHYKAAEKHERLGGLLIKQGALREAAAELERSLSINPGALRIYPILHALYERRGDTQRAASTTRRQRYASSFFE